MNNDFKKYKKIIDKLCDQVASRNFDGLFAAATKSLSNKERFLLKMEIKRLATPCTRLIDLRGHVDGECKAFEHENRRHYLDDVALEVFQQQVERYGGYTVGVYEATTNTENNYRVIYEKEKQQRLLNGNQKDEETEKEQYSAAFYRLGQYFDRCEKRLNYAVALYITLSDGSGFDSVTVDLSVHGCSFRVKEVMQFTLEQTVYIKFTGFNELFPQGEHTLYQYTIKNIEPHEKDFFIGAERVIQDELSDKTFSDFLTTFIEENKRRYKVNLDNTIDAVKTRAFEQFILPRSNELPVFLEKSTQGLLPRYILKSNNNDSIFQYWQDEQQHSTLDALITGQRLLYLKKYQDINKHLLVFSFIHRFEGKVFFYTADEIQLKKDPLLMQHYLAFAASKSSFTISSIALQTVDIDKAQPCYALSAFEQERYEYLKQPLPKDTNDTLKKLPYLVVVKDITEQANKAVYHGYQYDETYVRQLKKYGHKRAEQPIIVDDIMLDYTEKRQESRYYYPTVTALKKADISREGVLNDFSVSGLKITLEQATSLKKDDIVYVSFPKLQKMSSSYKLIDVPYVVLRVSASRKIINLKVLNEGKAHTGRQFFQLFISQNKDQLTLQEGTSDCPALLKTLRNIYGASKNMPSLIFQSSGSRYKVDKLACSNETHSLLKIMKTLSVDKDKYNLYPLFAHPETMNILTNSLKKLPRNAMAKTYKVYLAINMHAPQINQIVTIRLAQDFKNQQAVDAFIKQTLTKGDFYSVMIKLSRVSEPCIDYLAPELNYITSYAIHHGKQLEREIWSVAGIAQLFDVTNEEMFRFNMQQQIKTIDTGARNV